MEPSIRSSNDSPNHLENRESRRGFAVLITLTLLSFLVLLLVSLLALTRVETQVAGNGERLAQARQNALVALSIALGQLQKSAGPDQRISGTADLAGDVTGSRLSAGASPSNTQSIAAISNGLTSLQAGTRYWAGIWGNANPSAPTLNNKNIYEQTPSPVLLTWLVSGNESTTFKASTVAATFGQITASNGNAGTVAPVFNPAQVIANLSSDPAAAALADNVTIGGTAARILIGPNTAGTAATDVDNYVVAPAIAITAPAGSVSGMGTSATPILGHYAWWVGDEGVKARLNLSDANASHVDAATDPLARIRLLTAPRSGLETLADFSGSTYAACTQSTTSAGNLASKVLALLQTSFLDASITPLKMRQHIHDFTTASLGLETDMLNGGLRRDLTYYLEQNSTSANWATTWTGTNGQTAGTGASIIPLAYSPNGSSVASTDLMGTYGAFPAPQWDIVRSFYNTPVTGVTATDSGTVQVQPASRTRMGISPVVTLFRLEVGASRTATEFRVLAAPLVILANPYGTKLTTASGLGIEVLFSADGEAAPPINNGFCWVKLTLDDSLDHLDTGSYHVVLITNRANAGDPSKAALLSNITFKIPAGTTWKPGEAKLFSLQDDVPVATYGTPQIVELKEGLHLPMTFKAVISPAQTGSLANTSASQKDAYMYHERGQMVPLQIEVRDLSSSDPAQNLLQAISGANFNIVGDRLYEVAAGTTFTARPLEVLETLLFAPGDTLDTANTSLNGANGERNSALRIYQDFNPRAAYFRLTNAAYSVAPHNVSLKFNSAADFTNDPDGESSSQFRKDVNDTNPQSWGRTNQNKTGSTQGAVLYDFPSRGSSAEMSMLSLGQLQHANLTADDVKINAGHQPGYAVGNSYASPFVKRSVSIESRDDRYYTEHDSVPYDRTTSRRYFDLSYLLNAALWDGYFFSTIPQSSVQTAPSALSLPPINPRLQLLDHPTAGTLTGASGGQQTAAHTVISGAFNINSTSVTAWASVLGGMKQLPALPTVTGSATTAAIFPRSIHQSLAGTATPTGNAGDSYSGFRQLTDTQIQTLAAAIVQQVRMRGPFTSLAHFINRALIDAVAADGTTVRDTAGVGFSGALQTAIDRSGLNLFPAPSPVTTSSDQIKIPTGRDIIPTHDDTIGRGTWSLYSDATNFPVGPPTTSPPGRSTGIPGWLTQADILQAIGPVIAARSDTFIIRTYGDVVNPVTQAIAGRAWCEAVVQRVPNYVDSSDDATVAPAVANAMNQSMGRRFKIIAFRWLRPSDI